MAPSFGAWLCFRMIGFRKVFFLAVAVLKDKGPCKNARAPYRGSLYEGLVITRVFVGILVLQMMLVWSRDAEQRQEPHC